MKDKGREDREKRREKTRREKKQDKRREKMKERYDFFSKKKFQDPQTRQMN